MECFCTFTAFWMILVEVELISVCERELSSHFDDPLKLYPSNPHSSVTRFIINMYTWKMIKFLNHT